MFNKRLHVNIYIFATSRFLPRKWLQKISKNFKRYEFFWRSISPYKRFYVNLHVFATNPFLPRKRLQKMSKVMNIICLKMNDDRIKACSYIYDCTCTYTIMKWYIWKLLFEWCVTFKEMDYVFFFYLWTLYLSRIINGCNLTSGFTYSVAT